MPEHSTTIHGANALNRNSQLRISWMNVARSSPCHIAALQLSWDAEIDIICVQEPFTMVGTRTSTHPGYHLISPVISWNDPHTLEQDRPRVLTYIRKVPGLSAEIVHPRLSRDLLWVKANGYRILNFYRQPLDHSTLDYIASLTPPPNCVIGGDLNARHEMFEPGSITAHGGAEVARWASQHDIPFIGEPGEATHRAGHVIDVSFSNIPFARTTIHEDLHTGSDHNSLVTILPSRGRKSLDQYHYRVPEKDLDRFAGLVELNVVGLRQVGMNPTQQQLNDSVTDITRAINTAIQTAGKPNREASHSAPWWNEDCRALHKEHVQHKAASGEPTSDATRAFLAAVRKAKREYWQHRIDSCASDQDLYRLVGWHKLSFDQTDTPLVVDGQTFTTPIDKAEALRRAVLDRFSAEDDLPEPPPFTDEATPQLPWNTHISMEEVERNVLGVSSTSPGPDRVTVRLLKACWMHIKHFIHRIYQGCLTIGSYPEIWGDAEVAMIPKIGKKDKTSPRSMRPIALTSCIGRGLDRIVARRMAHTAMAFNVLSPQHGGALPKRSAMDLVNSFVHDVEMAWSRHEHVTMVTMDVQGAFDALLKNRLLQRLKDQGWPAQLRKLIFSFLSNRTIRVRLGKATTPSHPVACGTPQGSPLSPILYTLYLAELLNQDQKLRFGYADDICIYRASHSQDRNTEILAADLKSINEWGAANKVTFAPEKTEMIHLTKARGDYSPPVQLDDHSIEAIPPQANGSQAALRWLGVWFDRKLNFKTHLAKRVAVAQKISHHLRSLANTAHGPPASSLRKAVTTCVFPSLFYGAEAWYEGRTKNPRIIRASREPVVSTRIGWHLTTIDRTIMAATRAVLPAWRTTPNAIMLREAAMPSAIVALEEIKYRHAIHLRSIDAAHPLADRTTLLPIRRGRGAGGNQKPRSKTQRVALMLPVIPRRTLTAPHFSPGSRIDPTGGIDKVKAAATFTTWWEALTPTTVTVFSDGSEQRLRGARAVTYGYAIFQGQTRIATGQGSLNPISHVFDAEAVGACRGIAHAVQLAPPGHRTIVMCIDSTSVIWGIRGAAPTSSQWAFLQIHSIMENHNVQARWAPGHMGIAGNELADSLADNEAKSPHSPYGRAKEPTYSGLRSIGRRLLEQSRASWWQTKSHKLSAWYSQWRLPYATRRPPPILDMPRRILARALMIRSKHGDFAWYHTKFKHDDATLTCTCGKATTPEHPVFCPRSKQYFRLWPLRPAAPPSTRREGIEYLSLLMGRPEDFISFIRVTNCFGLRQLT